eukprot:TRINITY_DN15870_c0_g1_i2.p1 TRINITY_DN15870_c0_g1~~TRINITY_DN15870_c0_g1_i2.p1  ORF type:complete len:478 (+),score=97.08 TRINITY_DN15870_c0_g1_i2:85-1518(+)
MRAWGYPDAGGEEAAAPGRSWKPRRVVLKAATDVTAAAAASAKEAEAAGTRRRRWAAKTGESGAAGDENEDANEQEAPDSRQETVCVVGGGPSGLACCRALCDAGLQVTLVQESRGLGGKLCTKYVNGPEDPALHFDMGVQLLRPQGGLRGALDGAVKPWPLPGRFKRIDCSGVWGRWSINGTTDLPTEGYVVGVPSMSALGRHLAGQCEGLTIHLDRTAQVRGQDPTTGRWEVEWKREAPTKTQLRYRPELADVPTETSRADFDAVVLAFEANKVVRGCGSGYKMVAPSSTPYIRNCIAGRAKTSQVWNLMVAFDKELPMPFDAATLEGHPSISWVAVNSSKPDRCRVPQCFMVFSTREWANWKQWNKREVETALLAEFMELLQRIIERDVPKPCFVLGGRWGNNTETVLTRQRPQGEFPMRALEHYEGKAESVWDSKANMGATGDWTRGFSVSDAYTSGLELAATLLAQRKGTLR